MSETGSVSSLPNQEVWSNEVKSYTHLALEGLCGLPMTGTTYQAIVSPEDPCATYDMQSYTATFSNCPPE